MPSAAKTTRRQRTSWGAVRKLPSGRFQARYPDPDRPGFYLTAKRTFPSRGDAEHWLSQTRTDLDRGIFVAKQPALGVTVDDYVATYLSRRPLLSPKTLESYNRGHRLYISPHLGSMPLGKVTPDVIADWWAGLLRQIPEGGRGLTSRARAFELLRATFAEAVAHNLLATSPVKLKVSVKATPRPLISVEQVGALVDAMPERWRAGVLLAAVTGLRFGELLGLRERDLDLDARRITVDEQLLFLEDGSALRRRTKTAAGQRTIALPPHMVPVLQAHLDAYGQGEPDAPLFSTSAGRIVRHRMWNYRWDRARQAAGLPSVHFHDLRHAALTMLAQSGATLAELMAYAGHAAPAAALRYQKVAESRSDLLAERLSAAWGASAGAPEAAKPRARRPRAS